MIAETSLEAEGARNRAETIDTANQYLEMIKKESKSGAEDLESLESMRRDLEKIREGNKEFREQAQGQAMSRGSRQYGARERERAVGKESGRYEADEEDLGLGLPVN